MDRERLMGADTRSDKTRKTKATTDIQEMELSSRNSRTTMKNYRDDSVFFLVDDSALSFPWAAMIAIILQVVVAVLLLVFNQCHIYFSDEGPMPMTAQNIYIVGTTVGATLITSFTLGQIRRLSVQNLSIRERTMATRRNISVIIGLGSCIDQVRFVGTTLSLMLTALITTALVVGVSPRRTTREDIALGSLSYGHNASDVSNCYTTTKPDNSTSIPASWFTWSLPDGTSLGIQSGDTDPGAAEQPMCEILYVAPSLKLPTPLGSYSYTLGGFPIVYSAAGAPYSATEGDMLENFMRSSVHPENLQWVEQCLPVFDGDKAIKCTSDAQVITTQDQVTVRSPDGSPPCEISSPKLGFDPNNRSASAIGACTGDRKVGSATVLIGSTNSHANHLLKLMEDGHKSVLNLNGTAGLRCEINIADSVSFKKVLLSLSTLGNWHTYNSANAFIVEAVGTTDQGPGNEACVITLPNGKKLGVEDVLSPTALATAAAASWQLLAENVSGDGWWPTLYSLGPPEGQKIDFIFAQASAMALSFYWGRLDDKGAETAALTGRMGILAIRVGVQETWGILLIAPSVWSIGVLGWLFVRQRRLAGKMIKR